MYVKKKKKKKKEQNKKQKKIKKKKNKKNGGRGGLGCFFFFVTLENFSRIWRRHHFRRGAANFDLCSALMAIGQ